MVKPKLRKIALIAVSTVLVLAILVIVFISPITKYLIEKYDEQYTGRQITMDWVYVNPFTGYLHFNDLRIYERESDSIFFSTKGMSANVEMFKLFSKNYEVSELKLDAPRGLVIQIKKKFNFSDLIDKFSAKDKIDTIVAPLHLNILNTKITNGEFYYTDKLIPVNYFIKNVNFESTGRRWDVDSIVGKIAFDSGIGSGNVKADFMINTDNNNYRLAAVVNNFDLQIIEQYLNDLTNYGSFTAHLDADIKSTGNLLVQEKASIMGRIAINDFHFGKNPKEDYASFDTLVVAINEITPRKLIYNVDSAVLTHPYFKYEMYDKMDNLQMMFGRKGEKIMDAKTDPAQFNLVIEIAEYIRQVSKNFFRSYFKVGKLAIKRGDFRFNDFSRSEKFTMNFDPINVVADSINKNDRRAEVYLNSGIKPFGQVKAVLSIDPKDTSNFDLTYNFEKMPMTMFNAYTMTYTSFPLDRGTIEMNGKWQVRNSQIQSDNHLIVVDPRVGKRVKNADRKWLPLPLIMAFIRERGNVIDYQIPITGNLQDPKFHFRDVLFDLLKNIFIKPPTTPYGITVKTVENDIEKALTLKWELRQSTLVKSQKKFLRKIADFLEKTPTATIDVYPQVFTSKEKEYMLFFEAKKKYCLAVNNQKAADFSEKDSTKVDRMSVKDSVFVKYLNDHINGKLSFTIQEKCAKFVGSDLIDAKLKQLNDSRVAVFMDYFKESAVKKQVVMHKSEDVVPYNGFSFYKINYAGAMPETLTKAYQKLEGLNERAPRKAFEGLRNKISKIFNKGDPSVVGQKKE